MPRPRKCHCQNAPCLYTHAAPAHAPSAPDPNTPWEAFFCPTLRSFTKSEGKPRVVCRRRSVRLEILLLHCVCAKPCQAKTQVSTEHLPVAGYQNRGFCTNKTHRDINTRVMHVRVCAYTCKTTFGARKCAGCKGTRWVSGHTLRNSLCHCCRLGSPSVFLRGHGINLINSLQMENGIDLNGPSYLTAKPWPSSPSSCLSPVTLLQTGDTAELSTLSCAPHSRPPLSAGFAFCSGGKQLRISM